MTTRRKRKKAEIVRDHRRIADLYLQGWLQVDIAEELKLSQPTVSRVLKLLQDEWRESALIDINEAKMQELAKIDRLEREYWDAWIRSCADAEKEVKKAVALNEGLSRKEAISTKEGQTGDPRFLQGIQWCINKRCEIIGVDAPKKTDVTTAGQPIQDNILRIIEHSNELE